MITIDRMQRILDLDTATTTPPTTSRGSTSINDTHGQNKGEGNVNVHIGNMDMLAAASPPPNTTGLQVANLTCSWRTPDGKRIPVLHGIDLLLPFGELAVVLGPVGAGKTTFLLTMHGARL
jgi:ABC-type multidrug transport system ATPase subunit